MPAPSLTWPDNCPKQATPRYGGAARHRVTVVHAPAPTAGLFAPEGDV